MRVVGLMSGTSLDGIDAVLVEIRDGDRAVVEPGASGGSRTPSGPGPAGSRAPVDPGLRPDSRAIEWSVVAFETIAYEPARRAAIHDAIERGSPGTLAQLHADLGEWLADAALSLCRSAGVDPAEVDAVGSHGQTVWHHPPDEGSSRGHTLQLGDPATIAERTGIRVVSDFRSRDMAAGGEGAPLVPWVDRLLFSADRVRVLQNIGGMANATRVPARGSDEAIVAFDTGPGNAIIDAAMELATDGARRYDANGEWALRGRVDGALLEELLADPYFRRPPPKSTGRERFGRDYVARLVAARAPGDRDAWAGLVATLTALVARSIADAVSRWAAPGQAGEMVVTGGGAENPVLMKWLGAELAPVPVHHGSVLDIDPAAKEAIAFAVLAWAHLTGRPANIPAVTGAAGPRVLGSLTPGS